MNPRAAFALALALPVVGLAASWAVTHQRAQLGTVWEVPVMGYDPRDLLRGHYVIYNYDWPGLDRQDTDVTAVSALCLAGTAPVISRTYRPEDEACEHRVVATGGLGDPEGGLASGRLYVAQDKAGRLEKQLRNPRLQGVIRIRVRDDGHITPVEMTFRPRPPEPLTPSAEPQSSR